MLQTFGFAIVKKAHTLLAQYERVESELLKRDIIEELWSSLCVPPGNYRGISRDPLMPYPSCDANLIRSFELSEIDMRSDAKARERFYDLVGPVEDAEDFDDDLLPTLGSAREVYGLTDDPSSHEIIRLDRCDQGSNPKTLGFDVGYWGGDHFSLVCDVWVMPCWHPPAQSDSVALAEFARRLNAHVLFSSAQDAATFRKWYITREWAEQENHEGQFVIIRVDSEDPV